MWRHDYTRSVKIILLLVFLLFLFTSCGDDKMIIEPEQIVINELMILPNQLSLTFEYTNSSITAKCVEYSITGRNLQISIIGGLIYPWTTVLHSFIIEVDSNNYDCICICGNNTKAQIWP